MHDHHHKELQQHAGHHYHLVEEEVVAKALEAELYCELYYYYLQCLVYSLAQAFDKDYKATMFS